MDKIKTKRRRNILLLALMFISILISAEHKAAPVESQKKRVVSSVNRCNNDVFTPNGRVNQNKLITVGSKPHDDYKNVVDAVIASQGTLVNPQTIYIRNGIYVGSVDVRKKYVRLVGESIDKTIIKTEKGDYYYPPINCSGSFYAENISFIATSDKKNNEPRIYAYGVHMDSDFQKGVTEFKNCFIFSEQNSAFGIGLRGGQTLIIDGCTIDRNYAGGSYAGGTLYVHNAVKAEENQVLIVKNSSIGASEGRTLVIDDAAFNAGNVDINTVFKFYNNIFYSNQHGISSSSYTLSTSPINGGLCGRIQLSKDSHGNNLKILNGKSESD